MDLRQLEIIRAIVETGSFTAAGKKLDVSQSAISRQVLMLEEELNEAVFLRVGRRIRITPAGEALLQLSHRVFLDMRDTVARITDAQASLIGPVRLAGGMTVCLYVFPALLRDFRKHHPDADLKIIAGATDKCLAGLRSGQADAALLTLPISDADLVTVPALQEELLLVTAPGHPLTRKSRITPADLRNQAFVLFETGSNTRRVVNEFFVRHEIGPQVVTETENVEIIKALVRAGLGISIVSYQAVAREVASGQFFCARIDDRPLIRETGWVYMRANRVPRAVQEVLASFERIKPRLRAAPPPGRAPVAPGSPPLS